MTLKSRLGITQCLLSSIRGGGGACNKTFSDHVVWKLFNRIAIDKVSKIRRNNQERYDSLIAPKKSRIADEIDKAYGKLSKGVVKFYNNGVVQALT